MTYKDVIAETYRETIKRASASLEERERPRGNIARLSLLELPGDTCIEDFKSMCNDQHRVISQVVRTLLREYTDKMNDLPPEARP